MSHYLEAALEAVRQAGETIMKYYDGGVAVDIKSDDSPVTVADREAEETIRQFLAGKFPEHRFIGEEFGAEDLKPGDYAWIIDPIDGTKNFIRGIDLWATLLALWHDGDVQVGVINIPTTGECLYAEKGTGAFLDGTPLHVSAVTHLNESYMSYGSVKYFSQTGKERQLLALGEKLRWARGVGDCWSYSWLAQGKIDIMAEAKVKIWDIAPMKVIIEEAGGRVTQLDGSPVDLGATTVLATNGVLHESIVGAFR